MTRQTSKAEQLLEILDMSELADDSTRKAIVDSQAFKEYLVDDVGCEVLSIYVANDALLAPSQSLPPLQLLSQAEDDGITPYPTYKVKIVPSGFEGTPNGQIEDDNRRQAQIRKSEQGKFTTAQMCSEIIAASGPDGFMTVPFGEIIAHSFSLQVLENCASSTTWEECGAKAWDFVEKVYAGRLAAEGLDCTELARAIFAWGGNGGVHDVNRNHNTSREWWRVSNCLSTVLKSGMPDHQNAPSLVEFRARWAQECGSVFDARLSKSSDKSKFWAHAVVNPHVENVLRSFGHFVAVFRSPLAVAGTSPAPTRAFAICTVRSADTLAAASAGGTLARVLRRLARIDLALYEYRHLEDVRRAQLRLLGLLDRVADSDQNGPGVMREAGAVALNSRGVRYAVVAWRDVGATCMGTRSAADGVRDPDRWYAHWTATTAAALNLVAKHASGSNEPVMLADDARMEASRIFGVELRPEELCLLVPSRVAGDAAISGGIILVGSDALKSTASKEHIRQISSVLANGMAMPFRSSTRGIFSLLTRWVYAISRFLRHPIEGARSSWAGRLQARPRDDRPLGDGARQQRVVDFSVASLLEGARFGIVGVGVLFLVIVGRIVLLTASHLLESNWGGSAVAIGVLLSNLEHAVMAFSICLGTIGIVFLLKPNLAAGQPAWMRRFAEPGTLESTLIRVASLILTIDLLKEFLKVVMPSRDPVLDAMPLLLRVAGYLAFGVTLAILSRFVMEEPKPSHARD